MKGGTTVLPYCLKPVCCCHNCLSVVEFRVVLFTEVFSVQIDSYVCLPANHVPLMLLGNAGTGKSSVMCRAADQAVNKALTGNIPGYSWIHTYLA